MIKFALIKERKTPPDRRVVFSPEKLQEAAKKFPEASFKVEHSDVRIFSDEAYRRAGFEVVKDVSDCDVLLGVKEVPVSALIPHKKYFFFSHTIKEQPYNRDLLREILKKNIELYDHEVITNEKGARLIGFGRYAGLVGTYNGIRAIGQKEHLFELPKAESLPDLNAMLIELKKIELPAMKILLSGSGKVAAGAREILEHIEVRELGVDDYLEKKYTTPVFCQIDVLDYNRRKDRGGSSIQEFYKEPEKYESDFYRFSRVSDFFIAGHFYGQGAPPFYTEADVKKEDFRIRYVADISCDINGPIASTIKASTIADPLYGYDRSNGKEVAFEEKDAIGVMAVDNLPCELPKDASEGFGEMFLENVLPAFFNGDKDGILERARMTKNGQLTQRFRYLEDFVKGKE